MPRPERPLDASSGPVHQFATDSRQLRADCGSPPYREMARVTHFSKATLSAAAAGARLPTWDVTSSYVRACGQDPEEWRLRWQNARTELGLPATPPVRYQGGQQSVADNNDPKKTGCAFDPAVTTLDAVEIDTSAENYLGIAELRYSPQCQAAWGRFTPSSRMNYLRNATITIVAFPPASHTRGTLFGVAFDGQDAFGTSCRRALAASRSP